MKNSSWHGFNEVLASPLTIAFALCAVASLSLRAQSATFGGNAQHTAQFSAPAQHLNRIRWSTAIEPVNNGTHYGAPLITRSNSVVLAVISNSIFSVNIYEGATGRLKYSLPTDYVSPPNYGWRPTYGAVLADVAGGTRLYYPGGGGTVYYIDNPDSDTPATPTQLCFYESMDAYATNASALNASVFINAPLTADTNGTIYLSFRVNGTAPDPLSTTSSGYARIATDGSGIYVLATNATVDTNAILTLNDCAPALSNDGATLYVVAKGTNSLPAYLLGLDSTTLATKYQTVFRDPRSGGLLGIYSTDATASPTIGPDGDVFMAVFSAAFGSLGFTMHFTADLATQKLPASFGWDYTQAIVPTNMVRGYAGPSSYLLFSKYNSYNRTDVRDPNQVALLDPNVEEFDRHAGNGGVRVMREVYTIASPDPHIPEWCINTAAVNVPTASIFIPNEDGRIYRWNLLSNTLCETISLGGGYGEPYVPTVIAPDGAVYTIFASRMFALDSPTNLVVTAFSSVEDERTTVIGKPLTFTAVVTNPASTGPTPGGTVSFFDSNTAITTNVALTDGLASITTTNLAAGKRYINVTYSGDGLYPTGMVTLIQNVHSKAPALSLTSTVPVLGSNFVRFDATVAASSFVGSGMVTFWDGVRCLGQIALTNGHTFLNVTNLGVGSHAVRADYNSDYYCASSSGKVFGVRGRITSASLSPDGSFRVAFTNAGGAPFSVLATPDISLRLTQWQVLGPAIEVAPGKFEFTDSQTLNFSASHYYRIRSP